MTAVRPNTLSVSHSYHPAYSGATGLAPAVQGMPQGGLQVSAPNNNADYEALRSQAHETYRNGDFHSALQLCQSVRPQTPFRCCSTNRCSSFVHHYCQSKWRLHDEVIHLPSVTVFIFVALHADKHSISDPLHAGRHSISDALHMGSQSIRGALPVGRPVSSAPH